MHTGPVVHVVTDDALDDDDLTGVLARLARREVSADELRAAAQARAEQADARLGAVATWIPDPVAPVAADAPLAGVPSLLKDNEDLVGYPTTQGSWATPDRPAAATSPWVEQFLRLGLAPIAKTTLPEFGLTATTESSRFGATRNPWDTTRSSGGSSGGSAALVAAGVVPLAHANDGGGSIRIPAACCGLVGLKPTRGRLVDRAELERLPVRITTQGVLTRSVRDTALYYAVAERDYRDPHLPEVGHVTGPDPQRWRVGLVLQGIRGTVADAATTEAVRSVARTLEAQGHHVEEIDVPVPDGFGPDFLRYWALISFVMRYAGGTLFGAGYDGRRTEELTRGLARFARDNMWRVPAALRRLQALADAHEGDVFERFDVLVSPVLGHEPPLLGYLGPDVEFRTHLVRLLRFAMFTPMQNVTGSPAMSLPLGRSASGRPLGVQIAAPFGHERRLLALAYELEEAMPWPLTPAALGQ